MKIFLASIFAQTILSAYIFYHAWNAVSPRRTGRFLLIVFFGLEIWLYFTGYFFHKHLGDTVLYFIQIVCGTWFVASIYFSMLLLIMDGLRAINHFFPYFPLFIRKHYKQTKQFLFYFFIALVVFFLICGYYSYSHPKVKYQTIVIPKKAGKIDTLRMAYAADIHTGYIVDRAQVRKYVDLINAQQCDMILLGGDLIDFDLHPLNMQHMDAEFRRLHAPMGVYAVLGNHEYRFNTEKKMEWLRSAGMTILRDSVIMPEMSFYLIGRDDKHNPDRRSLSYLTAGLDRSKPLMVLDHQPTNIVENIMNSTDFIMQGHVHDGQIWPYNYVMNWYWDGFGEGYRKVGNTQVYVTSGLGLSGPPYRVFTDSEIIVFEVIMKP